MRRARSAFARLAAVALLAGVVTGTVPGTAPQPARADSVSDRKSALDQEIAQLKDTLEGASGDLVDAAVALRTTQAKLADARDALAAAESDLTAARRKDAELASRLAFAQAEQDKAQAQIDARAADETATRATLGRIAREAYLSSGLSTLSVALQSDSPQQFEDRMTAAGAALRSQSGAIDRLAAQQADLRASGARLDAIRAQQAELKRQSDVVVAQLAAAEAAARAAQTEIATQVTQETAALALIRTKIAAEQARMNALQTEQTKLQAILADRARRAALAHRSGSGGSGGPGPSSGYLNYPANGPITSQFGLRYHPILHYWRLHSGIDFGIACGTPVYAAAPGAVISAGWAGGYGNRVVIDHGWVAGADLATTYNHLTRIVVHGGSVARGQLIAYSGTTGLSTGCHLHFETLVNGVYVNPMRFI